MTDVMEGVLKGRYPDRKRSDMRWEGCNMSVYVVRSSMWKVERDQSEINKMRAETKNDQKNKVEHSMSRLMFKG
jgi:hypothetical protein